MESIWQTSWTPDTIHLCMTVNGLAVTMRMITTIKSILYYQNRVLGHRRECIIRIENATTLSCPRKSGTQKWRPIHVHIITNEMTREIVDAILSQWSVRGLAWSFYSMDNNVVRFQSDHA